MRLCDMNSVVVKKKYGSNDHWVSPVDSDLQRVVDDLRGMHDRGELQKGEEIFVESVLEWFDARRGVTRKQYEALLDIWAQYA